MTRSWLGSAGGAVNDGSNGAVETVARYVSAACASAATTPASIIAWVVPAAPVAGAKRRSYTYVLPGTTLPVAVTARTCRLAPSWRAGGGSGGGAGWGGRGGGAGKARGAGPAAGGDGGDDQGDGASLFERDEDG